MKRRCYLCQVSDPNETHFDPKAHRICTICGAKLWELAQEDLELKLRKQTVLVTTKKSAGASQTVCLTTGYEVDLEEEEGFEHLFNAVVGEVTTRLNDAGDLSEKGWDLIYDMCVRELHFVAGQVHCMASGVDINMLFDEFGAQWDRMVEKLKGDKAGQ